MAIHPGTINDIRYLKRNRIVAEQQLQSSWYRELIHSYGIDASYFRQDFDAFTSTTPTSAKNYDPIYGEQTSLSYWLSAEIVVYMEALGDQALLNKLGIETNGDFDAYILIDDFSEQFRDLVGVSATDEFITSLSGDINFGVGLLSGEVSNDDLNGYTSAYVNFDLVTSGYLSGGISGEISGVVSGIYNADYTRHPRLYSDYIYKSGSYSDRAVLGSVSGILSGNINTNWNGTAIGAASGILGYYVDDSKDGGGNNWCISPKVGDFFRLDFYSEEGGSVRDNHEEYEITQVVDRNLQVDGLNPLLSKYVWQMACVRRDPSYEDVIGASDNLNPNLDGTNGQKEEEFTTDKEFHNDRIEDASNEIFDYSEDIIDEWHGLNSDAIYGGYDRD